MSVNGILLGQSNNNDLSFDIGDLRSSVSSLSSSWHECDGAVLKKENYPLLTKKMENNSAVNSWKNIDWIVPETNIPVLDNLVNAGSITGYFNPTIIENSIEENICAFIVSYRIDLDNTIYIIFYNFNWNKEENDLSKFNISDTFWRTRGYSFVELPTVTKIINQNIYIATFFSATNKNASAISGKYTINKIYQINKTGESIFYSETVTYDYDKPSVGVKYIFGIYNNRLYIENNNNIYFIDCSTKVRNHVMIIPSYLIESFNYKLFSSIGYLFLSGRNNNSNSTFYAYLINLTTSTTYTIIQKNKYRFGGVFAISPNQLLIQGYENSTNSLNATSNGANVTTVVFDTLTKETTESISFYKGFFSPIIYLNGMEIKYDNFSTYLLKNFNDNSLGLSLNSIFSKVLKDLDCVFTGGIYNTQGFSLFGYIQLPDINLEVSQNIINSYGYDDVKSISNPIVKTYIKIQ